MKLKLDENLATLGKGLLEADGHDVTTVRDQALGGIEDEALFKVCGQEERTLVTLDRDFEHALRFPPEGTAGIAVLICAGRMTAALIEARISDLAAGLRSHTIAGKLWIVEPGRIRIRGDRDA